MNPDFFPVAFALLWTWIIPQQTLHQLDAFSTHPSQLLITASSLLNGSAPNDKSYSSAFLDILNKVLEPDTLPLEERIKLPGNEKKSLRLFLAYQINHSVHVLPLITNDNGRFGNLM
ncbi:unnamed protein product [Absidia cylindrospora]